MFLVGSLRGTLPSSCSTPGRPSDHGGKPRATRQTRKNACASPQCLAVHEPFALTRFPYPAQRPLTSGPQAQDAPQRTGSADTLP